VAASGGLAKEVCPAPPGRLFCIDSRYGPPFPSGGLEPRGISTKPIWIRIAGDVAIIGAWLLFVSLFLVYWAAGLATWQVFGDRLGVAIVGCALGGTWAGAWEKAHPVVQT